MKFKITSSAIYLIAFVTLAMLLLTMLPSSRRCGVREGVDDTLKIPPPPPSNGALQNSIKQLNDRLTKLEASVKDSKAQIAGGEAQANAAAGNLQTVLPS